MAEIKSDIGKLNTYAVSALKDIKEYHSMKYALMPMGEKIKAVMAIGHKIVNKLINETYFDVLQHVKTPADIDVIIKMNFVFIKMINEYVTYLHLIFQQNRFFSQLPESPEIFHYMLNLMKENKLNTVIDYGAGRGIFTAIFDKFLKVSEMKETQVIAMEGDPKQYYDHAKPFIDLTFGSVDELKKTKTKNALLILLWPPYHNSMGIDAVRAFKGNHIIFSGENSDGDTGTPALYKEFAENWIKVKEFKQIICNNGYEDLTRTITTKFCHYRRKEIRLD